MSRHNFTSVITGILATVTEPGNIPIAATTRAVSIYQVVPDLTRVFNFFPKEKQKNVTG